MREKLIELVDKARRYAAGKCHSFMSCAECSHYGEHNGNCRNAYIAECLIANGVTMQKWISVTERLPEKDGEYLVRLGDKSIFNAEYESKFGSFGYWLSIMWDEDADWFPYVGVTHWMPLPEPPKGE